MVKRVEQIGAKLQTRNIVQHVKRVSLGQREIDVELPGAPNGAHAGIAEIGSHTVSTDDGRRGEAASVQIRNTVGVAGVRVGGRKVCAGLHGRDARHVPIVDQASQRRLCVPEAWQSVEGGYDKAFRADQRVRTVPCSLRQLISTFETTKLRAGALRTIRSTRGGAGLGAQQFGPGKRRLQL